ncbi:MAG: DUF4386 domain-containing protein [Terracidiphilus sp.]|jgi:hypothetical protein
MKIGTIDESQRKAARVVGFIYLLDFVAAVYAEFVVRGRLIVWNNVAETARNIMAHEQLFRLSVVIDLAGFASVVALLTALYVVLKPVNRNLALLAAFWRMIEASICVVMMLNSLNVLQLLSGDASLRAFDADRLQALMMLSIGAHGDAFNVAMIFFGLGSTVFSCLWLKSRYVPRALAALGVFSSLLVVICCPAIIIFPHFEDIAAPGYYVPIAIFELTMGFWLLIRGLRLPGTAESDKTSR